MPLVKHFLLRGHVFLSLQLHVLLAGGVGVGFNGVGVGVNVGDGEVVMALLKGSYCCGWISRISRFSCNYNLF
jgi:hypothetical protein